MSQIHVANRRKIIINPDIINIVNVKNVWIYNKFIYRK